MSKFKPFDTSSEEETITDHVSPPRAPVYDAINAIKGKSYNKGFYVGAGCALLGQLSYYAYEYIKNRK